jgi:predicted DsbA family dithiol-disulfide isomerase
MVVGCRNEDQGNWPERMPLSAICGKIQSSGGRWCVVRPLHTLTTFSNFRRLAHRETPMTTLKIDFVSDIACPWCAVGLGALEQAMQRLQGEVQVELHFQPFELNPHMPPGGQDLGEHLSEKYGSTAEQQAQIRQTIAARGAEVGFEFHPGGRGRVYNTFNAHRLLHWAEGQGQGAQHALKKAFLQSYQGRAECVEDPEVLLAGVAAAGLDVVAAREVLSSDAHAAPVRERQQFYAQAGIRSVPAVIINDRHLISGGQPVEVFEQALRRIASGDVS